MKNLQKHGNEIHLEELKNIQLDILEAIDEFCKDHKIRYSMSCGTMLGAIRHNGYIPWDDDIDIYLLRDDYERLLELFPTCYKEYYCLSSLSRDEHWCLPYAKAYDSRTIIIEDADYDGFYGVNIDVYPIDNVPEDETIWKKYDIERRRRYLNYARLFNKAEFTLKPRGFVRWLYYKFLKFLYPRRKMAKKIDSFSQKWRGGNSSRVFECCQGIFQKRPFSKKLFDNIQYYTFENRSFMGFVDFHEYLSNGYGDYMKLPPIEKRQTHHSFKAYWK